MHKTATTAAAINHQPRQTSRGLAVVLSGVLALGFAATTSTAAHADDPEILTVEYVSDEAGTVLSVDAAVLSTDMEYLDDEEASSGWYVCTGPLSSDQLFGYGDINIVLSDDCDWQLPRLTFTGHTVVPESHRQGTATFWGGPQNTGVVRTNPGGLGGAGVQNIIDIGYGYASPMAFNGGTVIAQGTAASAGVGAGYGNSSGSITVQWRAGIEAIGGTPGGSGIGSGTSVNASLTQAGPISINTTGLVRAVAGPAQGGYKAGADIGTGGPNGGANVASSQVETVTVPAATVGSNGMVQMYDVTQSLVSVGAVDHAAVGSALTYRVTPASGYRVATNPGTSKVGTDLYRHSITSTTPSTAIGFTFEEIPAATLSLSATPTTGQTRPGDVVLSATASDSVGPLLGKSVVFTVNGTPVPGVSTNSSGVATYTLTSPAVGSYDFGASFIDGTNTISATPITGYSVSRATQTVTLSGVPATAVYGDSASTLSLAKQGTGAVTFSSDTTAVASVSGNTLSFVKAGTATITGAIAEDTNYAAASDTKTVVVTEATPTVALTYTGGTSTAVPVALSATVTVPAGATQPVSGASVQFYDGASPIGSPATVSSSGIATYEVSSPARGAHSYTARYAGITDYYGSATSNSVALTISGVPQPALAITQPSDNSTVYGAEPFTLTLTGQLNSTTPTWSVPNNAAFTVSPEGEVTITGAGTATVTVTVPADGVYDEKTVTLTITIAKRAVQVTATSLRMAFGETIPPFEYQTDSGLILGDTLAGSLKLADTLRAGANDIVEDVPFSNPNYQVTFVAGTLTVTANEEQQEVIDAIELISLPISNFDDADQVAAATIAYEALDDESKDTLPSAVIEALATAQEQAGRVNHRNTHTGIIAESDELSWGVRLVTDAAGSDTPEYAELNDGIADELSIVGLYDIYFVNTLTGERWQPEVGNPVTIELSKVIVDGYTDIGVIHQGHDGSIESIPSTLDGNIIRFEGPSFSMYGVTGIKVTNDKKPAENDHTSGTESSTANSEALSHTGGPTPVGIALAALILLSAGALLVAPRLRH